MFPEFAGVICWNNWYMCPSSLKVAVTKEMYTLTSFVALGMRSEGNASKNGEPTVGFLRQCSCTPVFLVKDFLAKNNVTALQYPPHSPDLAQADVYQFPRLKSTLMGWRFCDASDIIKNATEELKRVSQNAFQKCFQHLCSRW